MFLFDISNTFTLLLMLAATVLLLFLAHEEKKSFINAIVLFAYIVILIMHVIQIATLPEQYVSLSHTLSKCVIIDFVFVFISFFGYLWIDNIEAQEKGKRSLSNSLDWFWKKI